MALFNAGRGLLSAAIAPGPPERFRDKRPQLKNGRVAARPDWEELVPTFQDGLEFVGKMVARSAATAVMGPIMEGIEALHSMQAVKDAMSVYHEIVELSVRLKTLNMPFRKKFSGCILRKFKTFVSSKRKGRRSKGSMMKSWNILTAYPAKSTLSRSASTTSRTKQVDIISKWEVFLRTGNA